MVWGLELIYFAVCDIGSLGDQGHIFIFDKAGWSTKERFGKFPHLPIPSLENDSQPDLDKSLSLPNSQRE